MTTAGASPAVRLPLPSGIAAAGLPLIGRVAAGSPILAQEHVDQTYYGRTTLFRAAPTTC